MMQIKKENLVLLFIHTMFMPIIDNTFEALGGGKDRQGNISKE